VGLPTQVSPPQVELSDLLPSAVRGVEVVAVPVLADAHGPTLGPGAAELMSELGEDLFDLLEALHPQPATGAAGEVVERVVLDTSGLTNPDLRTVLLVGVGSGSSDDLRRAGAALARRTRDRVSVATSLGALCDDAGLRALVEGLVLGSYGFHWRSGGPEHRPVERVVLAGLADPGAREGVLAKALAVAGASWRARTLALVPSNLKNPVWMVEQAQDVARASGLDITVWDERELAEQGFGGIVGVGQASAHPPRLVRLDYRPPGAGRRTPHVALVGKGITFDSGGLSIKPAAAMMTMKRDMTGAGVVLSVMAALGDLGCPVRVTGLLPLAENAVGGSSTRPGDVLRHYGGRTSEVTNTDAEGRLVLADAIAYAVAEVKPDAILDVATLTGAIKVALGQHTGGMFANDDRLAELVRDAGRAAGEPLWRMPLVSDYEDRISSKVADADNGGGTPGAITAALFLQHFTGGLPWAHLDISSVGDSPVDEWEYTKGATGFGARALLHWLELPEPLEGVGR
jgi:leucyl aminopeptidase